MILKCKMCGGDMECTQGSSVMECPYCGTNQTLPQVDDERIAQMHSRANQLRRLKEFDKAQMIYEEIIAQNPKDAEAHWCALLCRYGIEYVEDPYSREQKPTLHRTQFDAITDDPHYIAVAEYADDVARALYEHEAQMIERIRKRYLSIASKEEPFDVFICYKETDANGQRTHDSVYAQEIYNELTREGYKVFFARITLEDKLGEAYEPYIFAALGSAKVMLVVGTCAAHMQAEWVKNEWKRFLYLMKQDSRKRIIPVYRDMEAYDMPEEFVYMQAQDYSRLGALQDLVRGVEKIVGKKADVKAQTPAQPAQPVQQVVVNQQGAGVDSLLRRAFIFLEDENWESADQYCERVLDIDPENARAYLGKLMADLEVCKIEDLRDEEEEFDDHEDCIKAMRFGDAAMKQMLEETNAYICERNEQQWLEERYDEAVKLKNEAKSEGQYLAAAEAFAEVPGYRDADEQHADCIKLAEHAQKDYVYNAAQSSRKAATCEEDFLNAAQQFSKISGWRDADQQHEECLALAKETAETARKDAILYNAVATANNAGRKISEIQKAIDILAEIPGWRDADGLVVKYRKEIEAIEAQERELKETKITRRNLLIIVTVIAALFISGFIYTEFVYPFEHYKQAAEYFDQGDYASSSSEYFDLWVRYEYKDSKELYHQSEYYEGLDYKNSGAYQDAITCFAHSEGYSDSQEQIHSCWYAIGKEYQVTFEYTNAIAAYEKANGYEDSIEQMRACWYAEGNKLTNNNQPSKAIDAYTKAGDYKDNLERISTYWTEKAIEYEIELYPLKAALAYRKARNYEEANKKLISGKLAGGSRFTVGLKANGRPVIIGDDGDLSDWQSITKYSNITSVAADTFNVVGLKADGKVVAKGFNLDNQCDVSSWKNITAVAAGDSHTVGLNQNGKVVAVGNNRSGQCNVTSWNNITAIAAGDYHTVGLKADGTVVAVGSNRDGECDVSGWYDIVAIAAGYHQTLGLKADGTVVTTDTYDARDISTWTNIVAIAAGNFHTVGLTADGTVVAVGSNSYGQCDVSSWHNIVAIAAGDYQTYGLKADGSVVIVGENEYNQCNASSWNLLN